VVVRPPRGWIALDLAELWSHRELLAHLGAREVRARYKQTLLGVAWVWIQPLLTALVFTVLFGWIVRIDTGSTPYPVFCLAGLLPWTLFAAALSRSSTSLVQSAQLLSKVYFPRLVIPLAAAIPSLLDFAVSLGVLLALQLAYGLVPGTRALLVPVIAFALVVAALSVGLWLAAINVRWRDVQNAFPFLLQVGMYSAPIIYPVDLVPAAWRGLYFSNPVASGIQAMRWALVGGEAPPAASLWGWALVAALGVGGLYYFRRVESTLADVV
jgi:lipopolysaccharide transport system permease protein